MHHLNTFRFLLGFLPRHARIVLSDSTGGNSERDGVEDSRADTFLGTDNSATLHAFSLFGPCGGVRCSSRDAYRLSLVR